VTPEQAEAWAWLPEYGELYGERVKLSREYILGLPPVDRAELCIDTGAGMCRPWRGQYDAERIRNIPGRTLGI
jgi:hypothetical protein